MSHLPTMNCVLASIISTLLVAFRSRLALQAEILALRHQLNVLGRSADARRHLAYLRSRPLGLAVAALA